MELAYTQSVKTFDAEYAYPTSGNFLAQLQISEERLPFTVKIVETEEEMDRAINIRHLAYKRHVPEIAELLKYPETFDFDEGSVVLIAESKLDGTCLGSMRIQTNRFHELKLEASATLPDWIQSKKLSEAARLGVVGNRIGRIVKVILFKSYYLYCVNEDIDWMVITARAPVDKDYEALLFQDVFPEKGYIPMKHDANIPHRVMAFHVSSAEPRWRASNHPLYDLVFRTNHPDVDVHQHTSPISFKFSGLDNQNKVGLML